jgi:hypothetical protein
VIIRAAKSLPITQLEIAVVAFSACAIIMYGLSWNKPKGVAVPQTLLSFPGEIPPEYNDILYAGGSKFLGSSIMLDIFGLDGSNARLGLPVPNDVSALTTSSELEGYNGLGLLIACSIFGGIHLAAWNFDFPTRIELMLWRATSLYCTSYMFIFFMSLVPFILVNKEESRPARMLKLLWSSLYVIARLFLLVEIFRTLLFLEPDAYRTDWTKDIPHLG